MRSPRRHEASAFLAAALSLAGCRAPVGARAGTEPATAGAELASPPGCSERRPMLCPGAEAPDWELVDFQPKSPRRGQRYGLEAFRGKVTVVALLAGW